MVEGLTQIEMNKIERRIVAAETGRNPTRYVIKESLVVLEAREARQLYSKASGDEYREEISAMKAEISELKFDKSQVERELGEAISKVRKLERSTK